MRISDWSSDVCSSDLQCIRHVFAGHQGREGHYLQARQARFLGGRYIRKLRSALVARNRQRLQLACLYIGNDRWNVLEQQVDLPAQKIVQGRSEEHTSELQSLMRNSYAVFCLKQKILHNHERDNELQK